MSKSPREREAPDRNAALAQYGQRSSTYDLELAPFEPIRRLAIDSLDLRPGQTVIDVGCGTGLSLAALHRGVGEGGKIVGIEQCPEMITQAGQRASHCGYRNVKLLCSPAEEAEIGGLADAALFHFTHDILRLPVALEQVLVHLKPGARVVATGLNWAPLWAVPVNLFVWGAAMRSVSSLGGLTRPWALLSDRVDVQRLRQLMMGAAFLLEGRSR